MPTRYSLEQSKLLQLGSTWLPADREERAQQWPLRCLGRELESKCQLCVSHRGSAPGLQSKGSSQLGKLCSGVVCLVCFCLVGFFFLVARGTQRDSDKLERLRFLVLYVYMMHFVLSCLEINPRLVQKGAGPTWLYCQNSSSLPKTVWCFMSYYELLTN